MMTIKSSEFKNKTLICFGDSTTWGDDGKRNGGKAISWPMQLGEHYEFEKIFNEGKCGSRIAVTSDRNDSFIERWKNLPSTADYIVIWGGVNDFQHDVPLGSENDGAVRTFYGALNTLFWGMLNRYPEAKLLVVTPHKNNYFNAEKNYPTSFQENKLGLMQESYVEAIMKISAKFSLPLLDLFNHSGMSPFVEAQQKLYFPDGMHFSKAGYRRISEIICRGLIQLSGF